MELSEIKDLVGDDFALVDNTIKAKMDSRINLVSEIGAYIVKNGGKRIRPLITLLTAKACGYNGNDHIKLAAVIEYIHTATLLHDDVIDAGTIRRNMPTANARWGSEAAVLVGDFLYSRSFQLMVTLDNMEILRIMADATNVIAEGEVLQLEQKDNLNISEDNYFKIIEYKTAKLFQAATHISSILNIKSEAMIRTIADFGINFGIAYQLVDDLLDYQQTTESLGKNNGNDLASGKITLPIIYLLKNGSKKQREFITSALHNKDVNALPQIQEMLSDAKAIEYAKETIKKYSTKARLAVLELEPSEYQDAIVALIDYAVERTS